MAGGEGNYAYLIERMQTLLPSRGGKILDFGCGQGALVARGRALGLDIVGADTYGGSFHVWADNVDPAAKALIHRIVDGKLPFPDETFDLVIANQVFEHIDHPPGPLAEVDRVLKPGGLFLASFPAGDVWFEGHVGLYFPHFLRSRPKLQWRYLHLMRKLGLGYYGEELTPAAWSDHMQTVMREHVWYHPMRDVRRWWKEEFGAEPESLDTDYMTYRIGAVPRLRPVAGALASPLLAPLFRFICHKRAGHVMLTRKKAA